MSNLHPLEQQNIEQLQPQATPDKAALESKIDQARPAAEHANANSGAPVTDGQQIKAELQEKSYPPQAKAEASLQNRATVDEIAAQEQQLDAAAKQAERHVPEHVATRGGQRVEFYKMRGRIGEELAKAEINGANLNDITGKANFANYDVVSPNEVSSVKVKGLTEQGEPRYGDYNKYFKDIVNPESRANQRAAADLMDLKSSPEWQRIAGNFPADVQAAANQSDMASALAEHSSLRIPYDQVDSVRNNLQQRIIKSPADYGLDPNLDASTLERKAQSLVNQHIKPIAENQFSSHDIGQAAANAQQARHGLHG
jgi:hypothetical protein